MADRAKPVANPGEGTDPWAATGKQLAAGFAVLTALFTFAGVTTGRVERILRNEPSLSLLWFVLVGAGIVVGVAAPVLPREKIKVGDAVGIVGAAALVCVVLLTGGEVLFSAQGDAALWQRALGVLAVFLVALSLAAAIVWRLRPWVEQQLASQRAANATVPPSGPSLQATIIMVGAVVFLAGF